MNLMGFLKTKNNLMDKNNFKILEKFLGISSDSISLMLRWKGTNENDTISIISVYDLDDKNKDLDVKTYNLESLLELTKLIQDLRLESEDNYGENYLVVKWCGRKLTCWDGQEWITWAEWNLQNIVRIIYDYQVDQETGENYYDLKEVINWIKNEIKEAEDKLNSIQK